MTKEELIEKLTKLYQRGRDEAIADMQLGIESEQDNWIAEMAENILRALQSRA